MVRGTLSHEKTLIPLIVAGALMFCGCSTKNKEMGPDLADYRNALSQTDGMPGMNPGSAIEKEALERFVDFYAIYSAAAIRNRIRDVYDEHAWFGDPYHSVRGIEEIERYFLAMAEPVASCSFTVDSIQRSGTDYYAHWTMRLVSKAAGDETIEAIGLSHVRFNDRGRIVFQQDYWDTSVLLDRLPVVGFWTRLVKGKIMKGLEK